MSDESTDGQQVEMFTDGDRMAALEARVAVLESQFIVLRAQLSTLAPSPDIVARVEAVQAQVARIVADHRTEF